QNWQILITLSAARVEVFRRHFLNQFGHHLKIGPVPISA
ncbi:unnamed protein product, partial [marine sediment metagenome]